LAFAFALWPVYHSSRGTNDAENACKVPLGSGRPASEASVPGCHLRRSIPEDSRPSKNQPFYHLLAENGQTHYVAYVSEQNLVPDYSGEPVDHPDLGDLFGEFEDGAYPLHFHLN
jgi:hemimethylated DNA binding protein